MEISHRSLKTIFYSARYTLLLLCLIPIALYANSITGEFVMDDVTYFIKNDHIASFQFVLETPMTIMKAYINWMTFHIAGLNPAAFHVVNILFHTGTVIAVYLLASILFNWQTALVAASLTAAHPIFTESVSWIGGGGYVMYGFFFLIALIFYIRSNNNKLYYFASITFFLITLTTSEKAIPLSFVFVLWELKQKHLRSTWKRTVPYLILTAIWLFLIFGVNRYFQTRVSALQTMNNNTAGYYNPLVQIPAAVTSYLELLFFPLNLAFFHAQASYSIPEFIWKVTGFLIFCGFGIWSWIRDRRYVFLMSIFIISLLPTFSPIIISWIIAERYVYLGAVALIIAVSAILVRCFKNKIYIMLFILIPLLGTRTVVRNMDWQNHTTLAKATIKNAPNDPRVRNNMGSTYFDQKNYVLAKKEYETAVSINPHYAGGLYNLGLVNEVTGDWKNAEMNYKKSIIEDPAEPKPYEHLVTYYYEHGRFEEAKTLMESGISKGIKTPFFYSNLGLIYNELGDRAKAIENLKIAQELDPASERITYWLKTLESQSPVPTIIP